MLLRETYFCIAQPKAEFSGLHTGPHTCMCNHSIVIDCYPDFLCFVFLLVFEIGSHYVAQDSLELMYTRLASNPQIHLPCLPGMSLDLVQWLTPDYPLGQKKGSALSSMQSWNLRLCWDNPDFKTTFLNHKPNPQSPAGMFGWWALLSSRIWCLERGCLLR